MQKAIFLDRDGVINSDVGHYYIYKPEHFVLNTGLIEVLKIWQIRGYSFIVISNQGGIAKDIYTKNDVEKVHEKFMQLMEINGIKITDIYFCPHHIDLEKCLCRKPNSIMIEKAVARYNIDTKNSWLIGDNQKDIEAAHKAGLMAIKINSNQNLMSIVDQIQ